MKKITRFCISTILVLLGAGIFLYKVFVLDFPLQPDETASYWDMEVHISFEAEDNSVKAGLFLPAATGHFVIHSEQFLSGKFGLVTERKKKNRRAIWSARKVNGRQHLYYRTLVQKTNSIPEKPPKPEPVHPPELPDLKMAALKHIWNKTYSASADLNTVVANLFKQLSRSGTNENAALLMNSKTPSPAQQVEAAVRLLHYAGIPARMVSGFDLKNDSLQVNLVTWLEVYYQKEWHAYTPREHGNQVPDSYLAWWRGADPIYSVKGAQNPKIEITAQKNEIQAIDASIIQEKFASPLFFKFSLLTLSVQNQAVYRVTLLIPLGAFLVVLLRNIIGLKTFGTFMPVLIALSFRETQLLWGVSLFSITLGLGLAVRFSLERLKLLVVPRLSAILITVVIIIAGINILMANIGLTLGLSLSLFPVVILSMAIERLSILWDERGPGEALLQGGGTLGAAILIYLVIKNQTVEHIMFHFPELLLILLAVTLLLGRYSGFRLVELYRFKSFLRKERDV